MPKLQKFKKKTDKVNIKNLLISFGIILLGLTILGVYKTFAIYKIDKEYDLIVSKIGDFRGLNLITKYYINGIENSKVPTDKNYEVYVTCDNANGSWDYNNWKLNIEDATKYRVNCEINFREKYVLASANSTTNTITTTYSNIDNTSSEYCMYGTDENNLITRKDNDCNLTNLNSDTTYYFKKCYIVDDYNICSDVKSLLTGGKVTDFDYTGGEQTYTTICNGKYKIEAWGASGGNISFNGLTLLGGLGAYTAGKIEIDKNTNIFIYLGENYNGYKPYQCFNGGGTGTYATSEDDYNANGGGATDLRLIDGDWNVFDSLKSRIMVAAGGGGSMYYYSGGQDGGAGGGLIGCSGKVYRANNNNEEVSPSPGGTQIDSPTVRGGISGGFGFGGFSTTYYRDYYYYSGGGGGYYGGSSGGAIAGAIVSSAAGGSSFISGHNGCNAIDEYSTSNNIIHTGKSSHYSGYTFTDTIMIDGAGYNWTTEKENYVGQPQPNGTISTGHTGNGYARITIEGCAI